MNIKLDDKLEKLNARNYTTWRIVLESLLKSKKLWNHCIIPEDEKLLSEDEQAKHEDAKTIMYMAMSPDQISMTGVCETAWELWEKIRENHEGAEVDLRNAILADFLGFSFRKGESIISYCGRFEIALARLETAGQPVEEPTKFWVFKNSLPDDVKTASNFWTMANPEGKIKELITSIKVQFHMDKRDRGEQSVALYGRDNQSQRPRPRQAPQNMQQAQKQPTTCTYCKRAGHVWKECRKLKSDNTRKKTFAQNRNTSKPQQPRQKGGAFNAAINRFTPNKDWWIVDSGASSHMTSNPNILDSYVEFPEPRNITFGDGEVCPALGAGKVSFQSGEFRGELKGVLYVQGLKENLLSISKAMLHGNEVEFTGNQVIFRKDGEITLKGRKSKDGLFLVKIQPIQKVLRRQQNDLAAVSIEEWHKRFGHVSMDAIKKLAQSGAVDGLTIRNETRPTCSDCIVGKLTRARHPERNDIRGSEKDAVLNIDTCGPFREPSLGNSRYFILAVEEFSNYKLIEFARTKAEIPKLVSKLINQTEFQSKRPVRLVRSDNGTEFVNRIVHGVCEEKGILHEVSAPYTPEQNGIVERANRTIIEGIRTLLRDSKLPENLWAEAAHTMVYTTNRTLAPNKDKTRYELFYSKKPDVRNLRRFGQRAYVRIPDCHRNGKLSDKGQEMVFVGYHSWNTYKFYNIESGTLTISCDARWIPDSESGIGKAQKEPEPINILDIELEINEAKSPNSGKDIPNGDPSTPAAEGNDLDSEIAEPNSAINNSGTCQSLSCTNGLNEIASDENENSSEKEPSESSFDVESISDISSINDSTEEPSEEQPMLRRITRSMGNALGLDKANVPSWFQKDSSDKGNFAFFCLDNEPRTLQDAKSSEDWPKWKKAMDDEMAALDSNKTWILMDRKPGIKPIKSKWVYKVKLTPTGEVERYKARLVAKGYSQIPNVDYKETFAPVASTNTVRIVFAIANQYNMELLQFDIKTAFLYGDLDEVLYMEYPEGYDNPQNKVCRLVKSLYGLKQAPRQWNKKFHEFLQKFDFKQSITDKCLYFNRDRSLILAIYVDDGLVAASSRLLLDPLVKHLRSNFEVKTMECESYLGFRVKRDRDQQTLSLSQAHYVDKILERFNMTDCKTVSTPEEVGCVDTAASEPLTEDYPFKELIGSLLYLVTCTRPDIAHAVSIASRTSKPTLEHWKMLKRILRYLKGSKEFGVQFRWEKAPKLVGYSDADYANDLQTRRSTSGNCILFGGGPIAWRCQRQPIVTLSTTEAEYVSGCELVKEILPIRETLIELRAIEDVPTTIKIDNLSTVRIAKNDGGQQRTKHIDVRSKWLNEQVESKKIIVEHVEGSKQMADILTKPLLKTKFITNRSLLLKAILTLSLLTTVSGYKFIEVNPIFFKPTDKTYLSGDTEFNLYAIFYNPCRKLFEKFLELGVNGTKAEAGLRTECESYYRAKMLRPFEYCLPLDNSVNEEFLKTNETITSITFRESNPLIGAKREKRSAFSIVARIIGNSLLAGATVKTAIDTKNNEDNIKQLLADRNKQRELLESGGKLLTEIRLALHGIKDWSGEVEEKLKFLYDLQFEQTTIQTAAAFVVFYRSVLTDYRKTLDQIDAYKEYDMVHPNLRELFNATLWDEPASKWSTMYNCSTYMVNDSLAVNFHFNMPIRDKRVKILEAVSIPFYNQTQSPKGGNSICWMKYSGPEYILHNTTNGCMTDTVTWTTRDGSVRSQTCKGSEDQMKSEVIAWREDMCTSTINPIRSRISDYEINGMHRIYCFPFNITIEDQTHQCPQYPFEIEARKNFKVANLEHTGLFVQKTIMKDTDFHTSRSIMQHFKLKDFKITPINLTGVDKAHDTFMGHLRNLPIKLDFLKNLWLSQPFGFLEELFDTIWSYAKTAGIILTVVAFGFTLMLIAPVIEFLSMAYMIIKIPLRLWKNSIARVVDRAKTTMTRQKAKVIAGAHKKIERGRRMAKRQSWYAHVAILATICTTIMAQDLKKTSELLLAPDELIHEHGIDEYRLTLEFAKPCDTYFKMFTEERDVCHQEIDDLFKTALPFCQYLTKNDTKWKFPVINEDESELTEPIEIKVVTTGATFMQRYEVDDTQMYFVANEQNRYDSREAGDIEDWPSELNKLIIGENARHNRDHAISMVIKYKAAYSKWYDLLRHINRYAMSQTITDEIISVITTPRIDNIAFKGSNLLRCRKNILGENLRVYLQFTLPKVTQDVLSFKKVTFDYYKNFTSNEGTRTCWMRHLGPSQLMLNTTSNCTAYIPANKIDAPFFKNVECLRSNSHVKTDNSSWVQESCDTQPALLRQRIQMTQHQNNHRVYCYPYSINVSNIVQECPKYPFEIDGSYGYEILEMFSPIVSFSHYKVDPIFGKLRQNKLNKFLMSLSHESKPISNISSPNVNATNPQIRRINKKKRQDGFTGDVEDVCLSVTKWLNSADPKTVILIIAITTSILLLCLKSVLDGIRLVNRILCTRFAL